MDPNIIIATILNHLRIAANVVDTLRDNPEFIAARATAGEAGQQAAAGWERAHVAIRSLIENNPQHAAALTQQLTVAMNQYYLQVRDFTERLAREPISWDHIQRFVTQAEVAAEGFNQQISPYTVEFTRNVIRNDPMQLLLITDLLQGFASMVRFVAALQEVAHVYSTNEAVVAQEVAVEDDIRRNMDSMVNGLRGFAANLIADPRAGANLVAACARFVAPQAAAPQAAAPQAAAPRQNSYRTMTDYGLWAASGVAAAAGAAYLYLYNRP